MAYGFFLGWHHVLYVHNGDPPRMFVVQLHALCINIIWMQTLLESNSSELMPPCVVCILTQAKVSKIQYLQFLGENTFRYYTISRRNPIFIYWKHNLAAWIH